MTVARRGALSLSAMRARPALLVGLLTLPLLAACDQPQTDQARRRRSADVARFAKTDSTIPPDRVIPFVIPATWDLVKLPTSGVEFHQPRGFISVTDAAVGGCNRATLPDSMPVLQTALLDRWPMTLAMRRGDLNRLARVNGFVLDSTTITTIGQRENDSTRVRRGEGWLVLSGHTTVSSGPVSVIFASVRYPGGCFLTLAARGVEINIDTLGLVLGTLKFGTGAQ